MNGICKAIRPWKIGAAEPSSFAPLSHPAATATKTNRNAASDIMKGAIALMRLISRRDIGPSVTRTARRMLICRPKSAGALVDRCSGYLLPAARSPSMPRSKRSSRSSASAISSFSTAAVSADLAFRRPNCNRRTKKRKPNVLWVQGSSWEAALNPAHYTRAGSTTDRLYRAKPRKPT